MIIKFKISGFYFELFFAPKFGESLTSRPIPTEYKKARNNYKGLFIENNSKTKTANVSTKPVLSSKAMTSALQSAKLCPSVYCIYLFYLLHEMSLGLP